MKQNLHGVIYMLFCLAPGMIFAGPFDELSAVVDVVDYSVVISNETLRFDCVLTNQTALPISIPMDQAERRFHFNIYSSPGHPYREGHESIFFGGSGATVAGKKRSLSLKLFPPAYIAPYSSITYKEVMKNQCQRFKSGVVDVCISYDIPAFDKTEAHQTNMLFEGLIRIKDTTIAVMDGNQIIIKKSKSKSGECDGGSTQSRHDKSIERE